MNSNVPSISVLVPVYKVEAYLQRCINSVLSQDFTDWEMILVDDGSPDHCPEICDEAARKDDRIRVVHKENGGLPSARLVGFELARGAYLVFLDSDDWLLPQSLQILYTAIISDNGYDVVKSRPLRITDMGAQKKETYLWNEGIISNSIEYGKGIIMNRVHPYLHSGIYNRSVFSSKVFETVIDNHVSIGEDWFTNILILDKIQKVKIIEESTYAYFVNTDSIMGTTHYSYKINNMMDATVGDFIRNLSAELAYWLECKKYINDIRIAFYPENTFSYERYKKARSFWNTHENDLKADIDKKFVRFIDSPCQYITYVFLYKNLYRWIKQKGHLLKTYPA